MARLPVESTSATSITLEGESYLAFGGCNYLGLGQHPAVHAALIDALPKFGISTTASRETTGNTTVHELLEAELAGFMGLEGAILSAEGYTANFTALQALAGTARVALIDSHAHRSLRHAAIASGMQVFDYEHLSPESARWLIEQFADQGVVILTDSVFAADGAIAPLPQLLGALPRHRATLLVDDCHGLCVLGPGGRGAGAHFGIADERVVVTTTLAKGLGCYGGAVLGTRRFIDTCRRQAWVYRSSTPIPPALAQACRAALRVLTSDDAMIFALRRNIALLRESLFLLGLPLPPDGVPIFTFALSPARRMERMHEVLKERGIFAPLIEYPGGPAERYFRVVVNALHTPEQIERLGRELARVIDATRDEPVESDIDLRLREVKPGLGAVAAGLQSER